MILFMVGLHSCTVFIFHCIEKIRGGCWDILTFSVHMASEVLNPSYDSKVCLLCYKSENIFNQHSNEQSQGNPNTRAPGKNWAWIKFSVSVDAANDKKIKSMVKWIPLGDLKSIFIYFHVLWSQYSKF